MLVDDGSSQPVLLGVGGRIKGGRVFCLSVPFSTVWNVWLLLLLFGFYSIMDLEIEFNFVWLRG